MEQEARHPELSDLRLALRRELDAIERLVQPGFERSPVFPGTVNQWTHTCGRSGCKCQRGEKHRSVRLIIYYKEDPPAHRSLTEAEEVTWRARTEAYKAIRQAMRDVRRWAKRVTALLDQVERVRRTEHHHHSEGLTAVV